MSNYSKKESSKLRETVIKWQLGEIDINTLAVIMMPTVDRICAAIGRSTGLDHGQQHDLSQEVWILWQNKISKIYNSEYPVEPILIECARRSAFAIRHNPLDQQPDIESDENEASYFDRISVESDNIDQTSIDQTKALKKIRLLMESSKSKGNTMQQSAIVPMPSTPLDKSPSHTSNTFEDLISSSWTVPKLKSPDVKTATKKKTRLTPEQAELVKIRKDLGWSQMRFAEVLGIGYPRLVSYEYGKTFSLPDGLLEQARSLHVSEKGAVQERRKKYSEVSMETLLNQWGDILGIKSNPDRVLSNILGKSLTSLLRWRAGTSTPSLEEIERMDRLFRSFKDSGVKPEDFDSLTPRQRKKLNL